MLIGMLAWVKWAPYYRSSALFTHFEWPQWTVIKRLLSIGVPIGIAVFAESSIFAVIALLIGLTRIYLGAPWASDVFAGWSVGAAWSMALWLIAYAAERRQRLHDAPLQDAP